MTGALLLLLLLGAAQPDGALAAEVLQGGQQFADAVYAFGQTNMDVTLQLPAGMLSLREATFR